MGTQSAAVAGRRRVAGTAVLLRPYRMHRDVFVRPGSGARPRARNGTLTRPGTYRRSGGVRRRGGPVDAGQACAAHGARAGVHHQRPRSARHRARRGSLESRFALHGGTATLGTVRFLGPRRYEARQSRARRLQRSARRRLAVGHGSARIVIGDGGSAAYWLSAWASDSAVMRKCDAFHTGFPSRRTIACGVSWRTPSRRAAWSETMRWLCTVITL